MPLHDWRCECGHIFEAFVSLEQLKVNPVIYLCSCGSPAEIVHLKAPTVRGDLPGYQSPVTGEWIEGKVARRNDLARHDCVPYDEGMKQDSATRKAHQEQELERGIDETIDAEISKMPAHKKELLEQEARAGDLQITRQSS